MMTRVVMLLSVMLPAAHARLYFESRWTYTLNETNPLKPADGNLPTWTAAMVCAPGEPDEDHSGENLPLLIFAKGWRLEGGDYRYVCEELAGDPKHPWMVALILNDLEDASVQPPLLTPLAQDAAFIASHLLKHLSERLSGVVVQAGHSLGGGTALLSTSPPISAKHDAVAMWAPGLYGATPADASQVSAPALVMVGSDDCVNDPTMPLRGIDVYTSLKSQRKALVVLKEGNHCFFAGEPTESSSGSCEYDVCSAVEREQQQAFGLRVFQRFARTVIDPSEELWAEFESYLAEGKDLGSVEWEAAVTSVGDNNVPSFSVPLCPDKCCSAALAEWGLCSSDDAKTEL